MKTESEKRRDRTRGGKSGRHEEKDKPDVTRKKKKQLGEKKKKQKPDIKRKNK